MKEWAKVPLLALWVLLALGLVRECQFSECMKRTDYDTSRCKDVR